MCINMKNKQPSRNNRLNITLSDDEKRMVKELKNKYSINISNSVRVAIREIYEKFKTKK